MLNVNKIATASLAVLFLSLTAPLSAQADSFFFHDVKVGDHAGPIFIDLFSHPNFTFLSYPADMPLSLEVQVNGNPPRGATDILRITKQETAGGVTTTAILDLQFTQPLFPDPPVPNIADAFFGFPFSTPPSATTTLIMVSLSFDFLNSSLDFVIPGGPNAGQRVDTYTYHFNIEREPLPPAPIPEPATILLVSTGLAGLGAAARRRRRRHGSRSRP